MAEEIRITFYLGPDLAHRLDQALEAHPVHNSRSALIREALEAWLARADRPGRITETWGSLSASTGSGSVAG